MKNILYSLLIIFCTLLSACSLSLPRPDQLQSPPLAFSVPQIDHVILSNGIRVYLKEDHELPLLHLTVMAQGGSIDDPAGKDGLADLLARSLRTAGAGNRTADEIDRHLEQLAADFSVSSESYALSLDLSLLSADLDQGLDLLRDVIRAPSLEETRIELARKQMLEGIRRQNDHPQGMAQRYLLKAIYGDHPLGRSATESTMNSITRQDLLAASAKILAPENLWIAVSGDFDRVSLLSALESRFGNWPSGPSVMRSYPPLQEKKEGLLLFGQKDLPQSVVMLGQIGVNKNASDLQAVRVMNFILGGGSFNSRMMKEIREEKGLAYSVYSYFQVGRQLPGPFIAQCETKSSTTIEALQLMLGAMEKIQNEPVTPDELKVAKESLNNSFVFSFTDPHEIVTQAMRLDFYGYPKGYLETYREKVESLTADDIQQAAREHLQPSRMSIVLIGNEAKFDAPLSSLGRSLERARVDDHPQQ